MPPVLVAVLADGFGLLSRAVLFRTLNLRTSNLYMDCPAINVILYTTTYYKCWRPLIFFQTFIFFSLLILKHCTEYTIPFILFFDPGNIVHY